MDNQKIRTLKFHEELRAATKAREAKAWDQEWRHLERAHILGQLSAFQHLRVHLWMIEFSIVHFD